MAPSLLPLRQTFVRTTFYRGHLGAAINDVPESVGKKWLSLTDRSTRKKQATVRFLAFTYRWTSFLTITAFGLASLVVTHEANAEVVRLIVHQLAKSCTECPSSLFSSSLVLAHNEVAVFAISKLAEKRKLTHRRTKKRGRLMEQATPGGDPLFYTRSIDRSHFVVSRFTLTCKGNSCLPISKLLNFDEASTTVGQHPLRALGCEKVEAVDLPATPFGGYGRRLEEHPFDDWRSWNPFAADG
ncbi:unnamed protein product [Soboliphyme baturini]|uniref:MOSC domain-containing protein n=1 Tax=Soboliphyme baturini TaxID=241478 RepID=A0A183IGJ7_9BILA|nr:unnamed protein product [Soboliphyme baturini]